MRVAVLMGGANSERHTSLASGHAVAGGLREAGYEVATVDAAVAVDPADPGARFTTAAPADAPDPASTVPPEPPTPEELAALAPPRGRVLAPGVLEVLAAADVVFVTVFAAEGEGGLVQGMLELAGLTYVGPPPLGCAASYDKDVTKRIMRGMALPTLSWHVVPRDAVADGLAGLDLPAPWVVKPVTGGSTIGMSVVEEAERLPAAVAAAARYGADALVEPFVAGRDFTVGVIGEEPLEVVETITRRETYDFVAKYQPGGAEKVSPARIDARLRGRLRELARRAHAALKLGASMSRTDIRVDPAGRPWLLEVNALPGLTPHSGYVKSAVGAGWSFVDVCRELVHLALERPDRPGRAGRAAGAGRG